VSRPRAQACLAAALVVAALPGVARAGPDVAQAGPDVAQAGPDVAQAGPDVAQAGGDARPADHQEPLAKVAVVVLPDGDKPLSAARLETVQVSMERALAGDARLDVVEQDEALADRAGLVPHDRVAEARALVASGEELLRRGQAQAALLKLEGAATQLAGVLAWAQKQELARAEFLRGAAYAVMGKRHEAIEEFVSLLAWRADFAADPTIAPHTVIPLWEKAQSRARRLPGGSVEIASNPAGAMAYVDGRFVGFTPTTVEALAVGTHYLTVREHGYVKVVQPVAISAKHPAHVSIALGPSPKEADLAAAIASLQHGVGAAQAPAEMQASFADIGDLLGVDQIVVLVAPTGGDKPYRAFVYRAVGGDRLGQAEALVGERDLEEALTALSGRLYAGVSFAPRRAPPPPRRHRPSRKHFWQRWWFWSGVGAVVASGVAGAILIHEHDRGPRCPAGDSCGFVVFSF
jgi:tetratricopeptide (TPR) repeat protein